MNRWGHPFQQGIIYIVTWEPNYFTGLKYSDATVQGHNYFPYPLTGSPLVLLEWSIGVEGCQTVRVNISAHCGIGLSKLNTNTVCMTRFF